MRSDFANSKSHPLLRLIDARLNQSEQDMQRAKHANRRKETRQRLALGEAVEAAGAAHLNRDEIIAALARHMGITDSVVPETGIGSHGSDQTAPAKRRAS